MRRSVAAGGSASRWARLARNRFYSQRASARPRIWPRRFPQKKIFEPEFAFVGGDRRVASMACDPTINGHQPRFRFNDVIKGLAARAIEMNCLYFADGEQVP
jgi:hypothetical protein